jgi:hypothetical protein
MPALNALWLFAHAHPGKNLHHIYREPPNPQTPSLPVGRGSLAASARVVRRGPSVGAMPFPGDDRLGLGGAISVADR